MNFDWLEGDSLHYWHCHGNRELYSCSHWMLVKCLQGTGTIKQVHFADAKSHKACKCTISQKYGSYVICQIGQLKWIKKKKNKWSGFLN